MRRVMIRCPQTGEAVPTGFVADDISHVMVEDSASGCAACGGSHMRSARDAFLEESS